MISGIRLRATLSIDSTENRMEVEDSLVAAVSVSVDPISRLEIVPSFEPISFSLLAPYNVERNRSNSGIDLSRRVARRRCRRN